MLEPHACVLNSLGANEQRFGAPLAANLAMRDAFRKTRHFLMTAQSLNEDEAVSILSVAVDFGATQVVDGNWGVHAIIKKNLFSGSPA